MTKRGRGESHLPIGVRYQTDNLGRKLILRPAKLTDLPDIVAIEREAFAYPWSGKQYRTELLELEYARLVCLTRIDVGTGVLAYAGYHAVVDEAQINNVAVEKASRGLGLGKAIMTYLLDAARAEKLKLASLEVRSSNLQAQTLYKSLGFKICGTRKAYYLDNSEDANLMVLDLAD